MLKSKESCAAERNEPSKSTGAVDLALKGYMCSESIVMAFAEDFGIDPEIAARISSGFAGGMAHGKTCGAVTGAIMVIGLKYGEGLSRNQYSRDRCFLLVQDFFDRFKARRKTVECGELLMMNNVNPKNSEEMKKLREKNLCDKIIGDAAEILEDIFKYEDSASYEL